MTSSTSLARWIHRAVISAALTACSPAAGPSDRGISSDASDTEEHHAELDPDCKPTAGAPPEVVVGEGQSDYLPLADLATARVEAGPQGGHHIWIAVRMRNLLRSGSRTTITGLAPETMTEIAPYEVIFTFDPDGGGYCKLSGLRFQLDARGVDYLPLLGKELDVNVTIVDRDGATGRGVRRVVLSSEVL